MAKTTIRVDYWFDNTSAFVAHIPGTNICAHTYPGSTNERAAEKRPDAIARMMIRRVLSDLPTFVEGCGYPMLRQQADAILRTPVRGSIGETVVVV